MDPKFTKVFNELINNKDNYDHFDFADIFNIVNGEDFNELNEIITHNPLLERSILVDVSSSLTTEKVDNHLIGPEDNPIAVAPIQNSHENLASPPLEDVFHDNASLDNETENPRQYTTADGATLCPFVPDFWTTNADLLNTPLEKISIGFLSYITMLPCSDKTINPRFRKRVATLSSRCLSIANEAAVDDDKALAILWYIRVLLIPTILFLRTTEKEKGKKQSQTLKYRLELLEKDDWSLFTLSYIKQSCRKFDNRGGKDKKKLQFINNSDFSDEDKKVLNLLATGSIAKAFKVFHKSKSAQYNDNTKSILQDLHPTREFDNEFDKDLINDFVDAQYKGMHKFTFSPDKVRQIIGEYGTNVAHGPSKWRAEHLKILVGSNTDPKSIELLTNLTTFFELMANGQIPLEIGYAFGTSTCMALLKKPDNESAIRPIAMGEIFRKICGALI